MQRPDVAQKMRYGNGYTNNTYSQSPYYNRYPQYQPRSHFWGHMAAAAAVGGLAGYLFGNHGGYGYGGGGYGYGGGMGSVLIFLLIVGFIIYLFRRSRNDQFQQDTYIEPQQPSWTPPPVAGNGGYMNNVSYWNEDADRLFRELQDINSRRDVNALRQYCTTALANELAPNLGGATQVIAIRSQVVDEQDGLVSVHFQGTVMEDGRNPEQVNELWNFVRNPGSGRTWLLAGIQPLE